MNKKQQSSHSGKIIIYHNTRCSKSRQACELLKNEGVDTEVVEYLKTPFTQKELSSLIKKLGITAEELVRKGEDLYKEKYKNKILSEADWIKILSENPILIERPIVVNGNKAVIARPPEKALDLL